MYFIKIDTRKWLGPYEAVKRYRRLVDSTMMEVDKWTLLGRISDITMEKNSLTFAGSEHLGVKISAVVQGVQIYEQQVYFKKGEHMAIITVASYLTDRAADYCELFYTVS